MQNVDQPAGVRGNCPLVTVINEALATNWHQDVILEAQTCVSINGTNESIACVIPLTPMKSNSLKRGHEKGRRKSEEISLGVIIP